MSMNAAQTKDEFIYGPYVTIPFCFAAFATSLVFSNQRKFPTNLIICTSGLGLLNNIFLLIQLDPSGKFEAAVPSNNLDGCRVQLFLIMFFALGTAFVNTMLAFSLWNMFYKRNKMSSKDGFNYQLLFHVLFWVLTVPFSLGTAFGAEFVTQDIVCVPGNGVAVATVLLPWVVCVVAQIYFIGSTLYRIHGIAKNVSSNLSSDQVQLRKKDVWMYTRFTSIVIIQICAWVALFAYYFQTLGSDGTQFQALSVHGILNQSMYVAESVIIMVSNRSLRQWILAVVFSKSGGKSTSSSEDIDRTSSNFSSKRNTNPIDVELSTQELGQSGHY